MRPSSSSPLRCLLLGCVLSLAVGPASAQTRLSLDRQTATVLVLGWPAATPPEVLETSETLGPGAVWSAVGDAPDLANGRFTLPVPLGSPRPRFYRLRRDAISFTTLGDSSPAAGETGVSLTRETVLRLTQPLAADAVVTGEEFFAEAAGRRLLTRPEVSADRTALTLFYLENLPPGARVRITLDGSRLKDAAGRLLDMDGDGQPGGLGTLAFETMGIAAVANTAVQGRVFSSTPNPDGSNRPLENVTITVDGAEETLRAVTDSQGAFRLAPSPAGRFFVHVDGRTAVGSQWPGGAYYPFIGKAWEAVAGRTNNLAAGTGEIFLPLIPGAALQAVSATNETRVGFTPEIVAASPALAGVEIRVPANALFSDNGARGGRIGMAPVPADRLPEPLPPGLEFPLVITIQTDGPQNFDQPIPVRFPNLPDPRTGVAALPGARTLLWSFNHDTGRWEPQGTMTISADGKYAVSDPGVGLRQPGWHGVSGGSGGGGPVGRGGGGSSGGGGSGGGGGNNCPEGEDCECTQEVTCVTENEGRNYAICALKCLGDVLDQLFDDDEAAERSPIDAGLRCIGGPDKCPGRPEDVMTREQKACMDACRFPDSDVRTYTVPCEGFFNPCLRPALHGGPPALAGDVAADVPTDRLAEQEHFWDVQAEFFVRYFGTRKIVQVAYPEVPLVYAMFDAFDAAAHAGSPGGVHLSASERAGLIALPRPSHFSAAEWAAMIDRMDSLQGVAMPADVAAAEARVASTAALLKARGWRYRQDGLTQGLVRLSRARAPAVGTAEFPARAHRFRLKNHRNGFVQRGRLNSNGYFEGLILAPDGYYSVAYLDPVTLRSGAAFFRSSAANFVTLLPSAPLEDPRAGDPDTDGDGLPDASEDIVGTSPTNPDTDGDGQSDAVELQGGTDPSDGTPTVTGVLATVDTPGTALGVHAQDNHAFVADGAAGLTVLRLNGISAPTLITTLALGGEATAIAGDGGLAVLATGTAVSVVAITNPPVPRLHAVVSVGRRVQAVSLQGSEAAVAADTEFLVIDAVAGVVVQRLSGLGTGLQDVLLAGDRMFGLTGSDLLSFLKVDGAWQFVSRMPATPATEPGPGRKLLLDGNLLRVGVVRGTATGVRTFDVTDLAAMKVIISSAPALPAFHDLAETGSSLVSVVTLPDDRVSIYDLSNPAGAPRLVAAFPTPGSPRQTTVYNGLLLVADNASGLSLINFLPPDRGTNPPVARVRWSTENATPRGEFGGVARVLAEAFDDVGIRLLELEVDGRIVATTGAASLRGQVPLPARASGRTSVTVRSRATDHARLSAWSAPITLPLVDDASEPAVVELVPPSGAVVLPGCLGEISARFSEPVSTPVTPETLRFFTAGPDGVAGTGDDVAVPGAVSYRAGEQRLVFTPAGPVGAGPYRAVVAAGIGDAAGNRRASPVAWLLQDTPFARAIERPPDNVFALGVPLPSVAVGLDHPLCAQAVSGLAWRLTRLAADGAPAVELVPLRVEPDAVGARFVLHPPEPLGTGRYRIDLSGPGVEGMSHEFGYRNTPNEVIGVGNRRTAVWKYAPGLVPGDSALVNLPGQSVVVPLPSDPIRNLRALTDMTFASQRVNVLEPIECLGTLTLRTANLVNGVLHARGPLVIDSDGTTLNGYTLNAYGGGYLGAGILFGTPDSAIINHPGSVLVVSNAFQDINMPVAQGSFVNLGTLRGASSTNLNLPVRLLNTRLRNDGRIELTRGAWYVVNLENEGVIGVPAGARFQFAQRLRSGASARIEAAGALVFGDYDSASRRVLREADADIRGVLQADGPLSVVGGKVTLRSPFTHSAGGLEVLNTGTLLEFLAPARLRSVVMASSSLRFNSEGEIGELRLGSACEITAATTLAVTSSAAISQGLNALGRGVIDFQGSTVMTNGNQSTYLALGDAVVRNSGAWRLSSGGAAPVEFGLRRIDGRAGAGHFDNRGTFDQTTPRPLTIRFPVLNSGRMTLSSGNVTFDGRGSFTTASRARYEPQPGGELVLRGTTLVFNEAGPLDLAAGSLGGDGTLRVLGTAADGSGHPVINRGRIQLAGAGRDLTLDAAGGFMQTASGELEITLSPASTPRLMLSGNRPHRLDGTLRVLLPAGMDPAVGQSFTLATHNAGMRNGEFARVELPALGAGKRLQVQYAAISITLSVVAQ